MAEGEGLKVQDIRPQERMRGLYMGEGRPLFILEAEPSREGLDKNLHELRASNEWFDKEI